MSMAPLPLAFERAVEADIYSQHEFVAPILDIGCGEGLFARMAFEEKIDTGIDPDSKELKRAAELGAYRELIECKGDQIPKPDGHFQTIFSNSVLEHIPDLKPVLVEAHRLLAPAGRFFVTVPSENFDQYSVVNMILGALGLNALSRRYRSFFNRFWRHYHYHTVEGWRQLAEECEFEVSEAYTYNPRKVCVLNDFLAPFSVVGFVIKRLTNRWTIFPGLRRIIVYPICLWAEEFLRGSSRTEDGGLVFLALRKKQ
jgi:SAM-dependent methyltransferase